MNDIGVVSFLFCFNRHSLRRMYEVVWKAKTVHNTMVQPIYDTQMARLDLNLSCIMSFVVAL